MKKTLIYIGIFTLTNMLFFPARYAIANNNNGVLPHIDSNSQFPQTRWQNVRHSFRVHIPNNSPTVSQLSIEVPNTVTWGHDINDITIVDDNNKKVSSQISINGKSIMIAFTKPVAPNTQLEIDINNIKQPFRGNGIVYNIKAKLANHRTEMFIGTARFRIN
ncbi:DUF2808 domain-containing protein [Calothrix sp. UHCC 0171]|uniref:DUF2808 domain-containing protein n=1 Tax=Calothrix sp. UHCC 0171 TaxID=3110245 RepID=UPI002B20069E|nr:DUF2808 domain-containing protein [Calothrix sp. UHCC 0171]MEA5572662.1 DUF2808 domain-containing protein [Calothrix sp. UHCC 0171]